MFKIIISPANLMDLNVIRELNTNDTKRATRVIVIDDKDVPQVPILRDRGYDIKQISDIEDINMLGSYDIVFVDIKGIGKKFKSPLEGAYVAKKTKEAFPYKKVILFTGSQYEDKYNDALKRCDGYIVKDSGVDAWEDELQRWIGEASDPIVQWKILRGRLLESDVNIMTVYDLEQQYIRALKSRNPSIFPSQKTLSGLDPTIKNMVLGLVQSVLFRTLGLPHKA